MSETASFHEIDPASLPDQPAYFESVRRRFQANPLETSYRALRKIIDIRRHESAERMAWEYVDSRLRDISASLDELTVMQIGANDGMHNDPLRPYLTEFDWRAILVEPNPHAFDNLRQLYANRPATTLVEAAVTDYNGTATLYGAPFITDGKNPLQGKDSLDPAVIAKHGASVEGYDSLMSPVEVTAMSVKSLLHETGCHEPDGLVVDTEGHDKVIIDQFLVSEIKPRFMIYEYINLSRRDNRALVSALERSGYSLFRMSRDYFAELHTP